MLAQFSSILQIPLDYLRSIPAICFSKKLFSLCLIPYLIGTVSFLIYLFCSIYFRNEISSLFFSGEGWLETSVTWVIVLLNIMISAVLAVITTLTAGAFFIESFICELLIRKNLELDHSNNFISIAKSIIRELRDDLFRLLTIILLSVLMLLAGFFPLFALIPVLIAIFLVGFDIIDLPLLLLRIPFKQRWRLLCGHIPEVLCLGGVFTVLLMVPLGGVLFLPSAYYTAVQVVSRWERLDQLPSKP